MTSHSNFSDDAIINSLIKSGEWCSLVDVTVCTDEDLRHFFSFFYELEDDSNIILIIYNINILWQVPRSPLYNRSGFEILDVPSIGSKA